MDEPGRNRIFPACLALILGLACPAARGAGSAAGDDAAASAAGTSLLSRKERVSYAIGLEVGKDLRRRSVEVTPGTFLRGVEDALAGAAPLLSDEELRLILAELQAVLKRRQETSDAEKVLAAGRIAEKNRSDGEAFLAANRTREGVVTTGSGLQYRILTAGDGPRPAIDDEVVCNYRGTFVDGTEFDSSYRRNRPVTVPLRGVIKGWSEALSLMPVGSKWQLFIPPDLAYGERGSPKSTIGPNTTLVFEVELVAIRGPQANGAGAGRNDDAPTAASARATERK